MRVAEKMPLPPLSSSLPLSVLSLEAGRIVGREDFVATEEPLEIQLSHTRRGVRTTKSLSITMRTPGQDRELAAGFIYSEGILENVAQLEEILQPSEGKPGDANTVRIVFRDGIELDLKSLERHFYTTSSCGVCGKTSLEALRFSGRIALPPGRPIVAGGVIHGLQERLRERQAVFQQTGGLHAAALFDALGNLLNVKEDVGRHNAVDKLIGAELLAGRTDFLDLILFVSGRASFELMQKALMAGVPILAAVGAPSSLAVDLARQFGATLLGFVRDERFNIYSGADRIAELMKHQGGTQ